MKLHTTLPTILLGLCIGPLLAQPAPNYDGLIQLGKTQLQAGNSALALATGQQAIQLGANRWEAYALAGGALMNLKRYEEAADDFSLAIQHAPEAKQDGLRALRKQCVLAETGATSAPSQAPAPPQPAVTTQAEVVLWESIKSSTNPEDFKTYLQTYPNGAFAPLAQRQLAELEAGAEQQRQKQVAQAAQEIKDDEGSTWTDPNGLMWSKEFRSQDHRLDFAHAAQYCASLTFVGHSDWRLPSLDETVQLNRLNRAGLGEINRISGGTDKNWKVQQFFTSTPGKNDREHKLVGNVTQPDRISIRGDLIQVICVRDTGATTSPAEPGSK